MDAAAADFNVSIVCSLPGGDLALLSATTDGHVVALGRGDDRRLQFSWDGVPGAPFDELGELHDGSPAIFPSADGCHVAYMAGRQAAGAIGHFVGRDASEDPPLLRLTRSVPPVFTRDGSRLAYGGYVGGVDDVRLIVNGRPVSELAIAPIQAVFSPDGSRLAYVEIRSLREHDHESRIVLDGSPTDWFFGMRNETGVMQFSPDGRRFAYRESDSHSQVRWVLDGTAQRWSNVVLSLRQTVRRKGIVEGRVPALFSPDSRRFAYFADVKEKGVAVLEDDEPGPLLKTVGWPTFSPDSQRLGYLAQHFDGRHTLVVDGQPGPAWAVVDAGGPLFSPDSRRVAVILRRDEGGLFRKRRIFSLVIDGTTVGETEAEDAGIEGFDTSGSRFAWFVKSGKGTVLMVDDLPAGWSGSLGCDPVFTSADRLAAAVSMPDGRCTVLVDGRLGPLAASMYRPQDLLSLFGRDLAPEPSIPFAVSPDGEHVAWVGEFDGQVRPVLDDRLGPVIDLPIAWTFDPAGHAVWLVQKADTVCRVTAAP